MNELLSLLPRIAAGMVSGIVLGGAFFGGLWWTARRVVTSRRPGLLAVSSLLVRMSVLGGGLFLLAPLGWVSLLAAVAGTLLVRHWMIRRVAAGSSGALR